MSDLLISHKNQALQAIFCEFETESEKYGKIIIKFQKNAEKGEKIPCSFLKLHKNNALFKIKQKTEIQKRRKSGKNAINPMKCKALDTTSTDGYT
ncbi:hypothetical protein [Acidaminobacterium chupaoyuni]